MSFPAMLLLALGLATDATAVSAARGLATPQVRLHHALRVAVFFGGFQALMPLAGWLLGRRLGAFVEAWDAWIIFVLLAGIGGKMLWDARNGAQRSARDGRDPFGMRVMFALAVATSIDAFAAGITLPMMHASLPAALITIGVTTAVTSVIGLYAGRRFGAMLGPRLDAAGGLLLIGLGTKALIEHLSA